MALQSSGTISLSNIQTEFGGTNPISMSEYYRGGSYVTDNNTGVPTSGSIDLSDFYGTVNTFTFSITSNTENANVYTLATAAGWDGSKPLICNINSGVYVWSDTTSSAGLIISGTFSGGLTVNNSGYIMGKGGAGGANENVGSAGGPAISNASSNVTIVNSSGAYIAGGGGGGGSGNGGTPVSQGGGGAGGGAGGAGGNPAPGSASSSYTLSGGQQPDTTIPGAQAGGIGGPHKYDEGSYFSQSGGRVLPGTASSGGSHLFETGGGDQRSYAWVGGGGGGQAGTNATVTGQGGGGGGWGAAGGTGKNSRAGGAGGAAISGTSVTLTNNGTIYGTTV